MTDSAQPMTDDRLRQLRILVAEDVGAFTNEAVASLLARLDQTDAERDQLSAAIDRTTAKMRDYQESGATYVNVRQVINLLSPTWPDGNYEAPAPAADSHAKAAASPTSSPPSCSPSSTATTSHSPTPAAPPTPTPTGTHPPTPHPDPPTPTAPHAKH